jgi:hypothetical protein
MSFGIRGENLEEEGWSENSDDEENEDEEAGESSNERSGLIRK